MKKKVISILLALALVVTNYVDYNMVDIKASNQTIEKNMLVSVEPIELVEATVVKNTEDSVKTIEEVAEPVQEIVEDISIEERIRRACEHYYVPYDIVLAIARLETGWFKSKAYLEGNNPGGLSINEKPISFDTIEEGVEAFVRNLSKNYFGQGLDTVEEIGAKYCPVNYDHWVWSVKSLMEMEV